MYIFRLSVYQTTREPGYIGGNNKISREFNTLEELKDWVKKVQECDVEYEEWLDSYFPAVMEVIEYKLFYKTTFEYELPNKI